MATVERRPRLSGHAHASILARKQSLLNLQPQLQALLDLAGIYRTWNRQYNNWSVFGQDHVARVLLNYPEAQTHDAVGDALKSIRLYNLSKQLQQEPAQWQQAQVVSTQHGCFLLH